MGEGKGASNGGQERISERGCILGTLGLVALRAKAGGVEGEGWPGVGSRAGQGSSREREEEGEGTRPVEWQGPGYVVGEYTMPCSSV